MKYKKIKFKTNGGQAIITAVLFFLLSASLLTIGVATPITRRLQVAQDFFHSRESLFLAEASTEDLAYRISNGNQYSTSNTLTLNGKTATATVTTVSGGFSILSIADNANRIRENGITVNKSSGSSFYYGIQSGNGGFVLQQSSSIVGNVYSNGSVTGSGNYIYGDVVSAGSSGLISGVHATSSAYAHTITGSTINGDAYYQTLTSSTVSGTTHPGSTDLATTSLPLSEATIAQLEADAASGGVINSPCPYIPSSGSFGGKKINCDLSITNDVVLSGNVWVVGNVEIKNSSVGIEASLIASKKSIAIIADKTSASTTSGLITVKGSTFTGSSSAPSYITLISQNSSGENGGSADAINVNTTSSGDLLLYAGHGNVSLEQSTSLKEVTAYKITLKNSAQVIYQTGLANLVFKGGPAGGYSFSSWKESF